MDYDVLKSLFTYYLNKGNETKIDDSSKETLSVSSHDVTSLFFIMAFVFKLIMNYSSFLVWHDLTDTDICKIFLILVCKF